MARFIFLIMSLAKKIDILYGYFVNWLTVL